MKGFMKEFREFIMRGNVMDMAVGIIVGSAFTAIVTSLVKDIITPVITLVTGSGNENFSGLKVPVPGTDTAIDFGAFLSAVLNFLIIAFVVFCMVKSLNKLKESAEKLTGKQKEEAKVVAPPTCPYCLEEVKPGATKCSHCGSNLTEHVHAA